MNNAPDKLIAFLAAERDAMSAASDDCPDENTWAALEAGLMSPRQRDELLGHARGCGECRRRMSEIVAEWPGDVLIAETPGAEERIEQSPARRQGVAPGGREPVPIERGPLPYGRGSDQASGSDRRGSDRNMLLRIDRRYYAIAAALVLGVSLWMAWPGGAPDASMLGTPIARLTDFGDIGITQRRTLSEKPDPQREDVTQLERRLDQYTAGHPDNAEAWYDLARALLRLGRLDEAARAIDRAVALAPQRADWQNMLGMTAYRAGQYEKAAAAFDEAIRLEPKIADYHLNAALALEELQRIDEAVKHWQEFLRLAPTDPRSEEIRRWIDMLEGGSNAGSSGP